MKKQLTVRDIYVSLDSTVGNNIKYKYSTVGCNVRCKRRALFGYRKILCCIQLHINIGYCSKNGNASSISILSSLESQIKVTNCFYFFVLSSKYHNQRFKESKEQSPIIRRLHFFFWQSTSFNDIQHIALFFSFTCNCTKIPFYLTILWIMLTRGEKLVFFPSVNNLKLIINELYNAQSWNS